MKLFKFPVAFLLSLLLFSCVEEEVVFRDKEDIISFDRSLVSVAEDETPIIEVNIISVDGEDVIDEYDISYESSNAEVFTIDEDGVLTPSANSLNKKAIVMISATKKNSSISVSARIANNNNDSEIITPVNYDEITVGKVTISENEAFDIKEEDLEDIINNGYTPRGIISNILTQIDINNLDVRLTAAFFDFKNRDVNNLKLTWESSNTDVLDIDEEGRLIPISKGSSRITVSSIIEGETIISNSITIEVGEETIIGDEPEEEGEVLGSGILMSNSQYVVKGSFRIEKENEITKLILSDDFSTGSLPDLVVYLSNSTTSNSGAQIISEDILASGGQSFVIPNNVDVSKYTNVLLYCRRFSIRVGFGVINR